MASHTRFPGMKTPNGVYGAQYQHPPHLMQNPGGVPNVMQASAIAPSSMTATSIYGVQPGHQGMVAPNQISGVYGRQVSNNPAAISAMQKQMKQKELEHQQQQEKMKKEYLFQEQKQRLKTMTGPNKGKQLSVDALMDSYLKPSALKPSTPSTWYSPSGDSGVSNAALQPQPGSFPPEPSGFQTWQDRDVPDNYVHIYQSTLNAGGLIDTAILYPILMTSGLPRELLGHVWSLANQKIPGQLTKPELFLALAMIGFVQSGNNPSDLSIFCQSPRPFPVMLSVPSTAPPPPSVVGVAPLTHQQQPPSVSVPFSTPVDNLSTPSSVSLPVSSLNFGVAASSASSASLQSTATSQMIAAQHSSLSLNSTRLDSQPSYASQSFSGHAPSGPQALTSAFIQECPLPATHQQQQQQQQQQQPSEPANHHNIAFPLAQWETSSTTSVLASVASNNGFSSASTTELRPIPGSAAVSLAAASSGPSVAGAAPFVGAAVSSSSTSHSFPPVFPGVVTGQKTFLGSSCSALSSSSTPATSCSGINAVSSLAHAPPLLPMPLTAADAGDKYAAFKDLRAPAEEEDDFADFVEAEVKESEAAAVAAVPVAPSAFVPPQPTPVLPTKSVSATEKIIENLNNFSISSKSRKSSANDEFAAFAPAENVPMPTSAAATASAPVASETWADFSQCFDDNPTNATVLPQQQMQQQMQQSQLQQQLVSRALSEAQASHSSSADDFGDFTSLRSGSQSQVESASLTARQQPALATAPPPMSDGYHFSDPFFSPDNGIDAPTGGGFANFNSKESTPATDGGKPTMLATAAAPYLDAVLTNGGVSRGSSIAAETQSVSSLELPAATCATSQSDSDSLNGQSTENNSVTSDDPGSGVNGINGGSSQPQLIGLSEDFGGGMPRKVSAAGLTSKQPLFGDRYSAVIEDVSASECLPRKWIDCLQSCHRMIAAANTNLSNLTSAAACLEFITAKKGLEYLTGIVEIYRVACRIFTSMKALGIVNKELGETMRDIEIVWQNLTTFLAKSPSIMPEPGALDFSNCIVRKPGSHVDAPVEKLCGVCLLNVEGRSKAANPVTGDAFKLAYGGRQYHASCANLWVNCVNPILPALVLPSPFM